MGKGSLGTLLELGPEGDLGSCHMAMLCALHTFKNHGKSFKTDFVSASYLFIYLSADVLVGSELPAVCSGQHTCL